MIVELIFVIILFSKDDYILLLNAYHSTFIDIKKTINTNINYIMNNSYKLTNTGSIINILNTIIDTKIFSEENINSNYEINKDDEIVRLYKQNKYIIDLIIALFENLLLKIKTEITDDKIVILSGSLPLNTGKAINTINATPRETSP